MNQLTQQQNNQTISNMTELIFAFLVSVFVCATVALMVFLYGLANQKTKEQEDLIKTLEGFKKIQQEILNY